MQHKPKVIFLDAVGTIFGVKGSVGENYGVIASQFGVNVPAEALNQAFFRSFNASYPPAFPRVEQQQIPELEFNWWEAIAIQTFTQVGAIDQFTDFRAFFTELYNYFATEQPWFVYADVLPALQAWQDKGITLGIISNFDTRIYTVLEKLGLRQFFSSITISSTAGTAKPEKQIFAQALAKHHCQAQEAWHIGDSLQQDYYGAKGAGMRAFLVQR